MVEFYGKRFELVQRKNLHEKNDAIKAIEIGLRYYNGRTLYDVYKKPSSVKVNIWKNWAEFFVNYIIRSDVYRVEYCVGGVNSHIFTILARISFMNGEHYYMKITPSHNRLYYYHD